MAFTTSDLDQLDQALASGELSVRFADGRQVVYRSVAELKAARRLIAAELATTQGGRRPAAFRLRVDKGVFRWPPSSSSITAASRSATRPTRRRARGQRTKTWVAPQSGLNHGLGTLRNRARAAYRNNPWIWQAIVRLLSNEVGVRGDPAQPGQGHGPSCRGQCPVGALPL